MIFPNNDYEGKSGTILVAGMKVAISVSRSSDFPKAFKKAEMTAKEQTEVIPFPECRAYPLYL